LMEPIRVATAQAINTVGITEAICEYLTEKLDVPVEFAGEPYREAPYQWLDAGKIHLCWICGMPYVKRMDGSNSSIELLAAPVMQADRYQNKPIYFSDVVVRRDSPFQQFADLQGASWAYNELKSHSGYWVVRYHLATLGHYSGFFGRVVASGAHQVSLQMVLEGQVDGSAIDTTVLEWELQQRPEIGRLLRVVETLGPSPIPPLVIKTSVPQELREKIRSLLLELHHSERGRRILELGQLRRFASVTDSDYDPVRRMAELAELAEL